MSNTTPKPNFSEGANKAGDAIKKGVNDLLEMQENTAITLLTFLTFLTIIMAFLYYFYFNGTGTVAGIALIIILVVMLSVVGHALMGAAGVAAGCIIGIVVGIGIYAKLINSKSVRNCNIMNEVYGERNTSISNVDASAGYSLYDYYIKTAYNCCSGGNYKNDYVTMCSLQDLLKQGVRGLDFEIYSVDDQPVVATSTVENYCVKETFNYIKFSDVIDTVINNAFSETVPNPKDPIIFHLRIKSENKAMYKNLSELFGSITELLMTNYTYEYTDTNGIPQNFGAVKLSAMMGKIVVIVDKSNDTCLCKDCSETDECGDFYEFVNMTSNSTYMQLLRYNEIEYTQTPDDLINQNRQAMTIGIPDKGSNPSNPSSAVMRSLGIQMLAMRYQNVDANVEENDMFFNDNKSAFVLKPEYMRALKIMVEEPKQQNPALSYATRTITSPFYKLDV